MSKSKRINTRLIAAAPELFGALDFAIKNLEEVAIPLAEKHGVVTSMDSALRQAKNAIKKALRG